LNGAKIIFHHAAQDKADEQGGSGKFANSRAMPQTPKGDQQQQFGSVVLTI